MMQEVQQIDPFFFFSPPKIIDNVIQVKLHEGEAIVRVLWSEVVIKLTSCLES
jgi:hypothetical protein